MATDLPPIIAELLASTRDFTSKMDEVKASVDGVIAKLGELDGLKAEPSVGLDGADALVAKIEAIRADLELYADKDYMSSIGLETGAAEVKLAALRAELADLTQPKTIPIDADTGAAMAKIAAVKAAASESGGGGGGLLGGVLTGTGAGLFGLPAAGSALALAGAGPEAVLGAGAGVALSGIAAALGGVTLAFTAASVAAVGFGTDLAGIGQAAGDIKAVDTAMNNLSKAQAVYGANSRQAAVAQAQLNFVIQGFSPVAQQAVVAAAQTVQQFKALFDQATGQAEKTGAQIIQQVVQVGEKFLPELGAAAARNMDIIRTGIQPFLQWLQGPGLAIFTDLENKFSSQLPTAVHAGTQAFELLARTIDHLLPQTGNFLTTIDNFVTRFNGVDFARWTADVDKLVATFRVWEAFLKVAVQDIILLGHDFAGTGTSIIQALTGMLDRLHAYLSSAQGMHQVQAVFEAHKDVILALLHAFEPLAVILGKLEIATVPALASAFAALIEVVTPLLNLLASNPFTAFLLGLALILARMGLLGPAMTGLRAVMAWIYAGSAATALTNAAEGMTLVGSSAAAAEGRVMGFAGATTTAETAAAGLGPASAAAGIGLGALSAAVAGVIVGVGEYVAIGYGFKKSLDDTHASSSLLHDGLTLLEGAALLPISPFAALALGADKLFNVFTGGGNTVQLATTKVTAASQAAAQLSDSMQSFAAQTGVALDRLASSSAPAIIKQHIADIATGAIQAAGPVQSLAIIIQEQMNKAVGVTATAGQQISQSVSSNFGQVAASVGRNMGLTQTDTQQGTQAMLQLWSSFGNQQLANTTTWTRQMNNDFANAMRVAAAEFQSGGQLSVQQLSTQLGIGAGDVNRILNEFDLRFGATATNAGVAGTDTGSNFGEQARALLSAKYGPFSTQVAAYDNALQAGINPIAAAVAAGNPGVDTFGGGSAPGPLPGEHAATGGIVTKPTIMVGEEAPTHKEVVLTENPAYRQRNLGLFAHAGKMLGVPGFATGGFTDPSQVPKPPILTPTYGTVAQSFGVTGQGIEDNLYNQVVAAVTARVAAAAAAAGGPGGSGPAHDLGQQMAAARGWTGAEWTALDALIQQESGWNPNAANPTSNARGIGQNINGWGPGYEPGNAAQQIQWTYDYIAGRYGDPIGAEAHEKAFNWYAQGGIIPPFVPILSRDQGGVVPHGSAGLNTSGRDEYMGPASGGIHFHEGAIQSNADPFEIAREVAWAQRTQVPVARTIA